MTEQDTLTTRMDSEQAASGVPRGKDRRSTRRLRALERRTGFDRRRRYPITGPLRESPAMLLAVLVATNALSALDFALTRAQLQAGTIQEGNPVLAHLFNEGAGQAWLFKTAMVLTVSLVIWHQRRYRAILTVAIIGLVLYLLVIAYHLVGMLLFGTL